MRLAFWRAVAEIGRRMTEAGERRTDPPKSIIEEIGIAWGRHSVGIVPTHMLMSVEARRKAWEARYRG